MTTITVRISPNGSKAKVSVEGMAGAGCEDLTKSLEAAIFGSGSVEKERTSELREIIMYSRIDKT